MASWWHRDVIAAGKLPLMLCFLAFVATFVLTRTITRMIRDGRGPFRNHVTASGTHIHHSVPGIILLIIGAFTAVGGPSSLGWRSSAGLVVGIGTSVVLDEALVGFSPFGVQDVDGFELSLRVTATGILIADGVLAVTPDQADLYPSTRKKWPSPAERARGRELRALARVIIIEAPEKRTGRPTMTFPGVVVTSPLVGGSQSA